MASTFWSWLKGSGNARTSKLQEARAYLTHEELEAIKQQVKSALRTQGGHNRQTLQEQPFLQVLCGWPAAEEATNQHVELGYALYCTCSGFATRGLELAPPITNQAGKEEKGCALQTSAAALGVTWEDVVVAKVTLEHMDVLSSTRFAFEVCTRLPDRHLADGKVPSSSAPEPVLTRSKLCQAVAAIFSLLTAAGSLQWAEQKKTVGGIAAAENVWLTSVVQGALWTAAGSVASCPSDALDFDGFTRWCRAFPAIHEILTGFLRGVGPRNSNSCQQPLTSQLLAQQDAAATAAASEGTCLASGQTHATRPVSGQDNVVPKLLLPHSPQLVLPAPTSSSCLAGSTLLHPMAALLLSNCMPPEHRQQWRLVFNSQTDGKSYNTLLSKLGQVEGATLLIVKEKGELGHLAAGYGSHKWRKQGTFFGDHSAWVARLLPDLQVFTSTGANTNFQWCGQGFSQLTNGIGFGGAQGGHSAFALLLDSSLDSGQSRPIATFGSPTLTHDQVFLVDTVECWLVQPPEFSDTLDISTKSSKSAASVSVLDKKKTDRSFMDLAGRAIDHSAGLRADEPIEV